MKSLLVCLGLLLVQFSCATHYETFDNCEDDDDDGTCSVPVSSATVAPITTEFPITTAEDAKITQAKEFEREAVEKAKEVLEALEYGLPQGNVVTSDRDGRFFNEGYDLFREAAIGNALAVLRIFGFDNPPPYEPPIVVVVEPVVQTVVVELVEEIINPPKFNNSNIPNYEPCRGGDGICSSAYECESMGGEAIGKCGNCMGCSVCCKYVTGCQGMTDKMITYFQSPGYPRTDRSNEACSLTLNVADDVCQVMLDLVDFEMAAPLQGDCSIVDNMEIINTAQPGGVIGRGQSRLCGLNSGQHIYVPVKSNNILILKATTSGVRNIPLARTDGRNRGLSGDTAFRWNVRVTQIPCEGKKIEGSEKRMKIPKLYKKMKAPMGCRQYFQDNRGKLKSFNFDGQSEISRGLNYAICVKRPNDACGLTLNALTFSIPASATCLPGNVDIDDVTVPDVPSICCTGSWEEPPVMGNDPLLPGINYFGFAGLGDGDAVTTQRGQANDPNQNRYFYCGQQFGSSNLVLGRTKGPLIMRVFTTESYWETETPNSNPSLPPNFGVEVTPEVPGVSPAVFGPEHCPPGGCLGFLINYDVDTGSC